MNEAQLLNTVLERQAPAVARCLSPLGRRAAFPQGIPFQASQAQDTEINACIGQLTDGAGDPLPLPGLQQATEQLDPKMAFLYSPQDGHESLRRAWAARQRRLSGTSVVDTALPMVVHGLTHGCSILANLFADPNTDVVVATPMWGNYRLIFELFTGARIKSYPFFREGRFNVAGLSETLQSVAGKAVIIFNFPHNPTGYTPQQEEIEAIVDTVVGHHGPAIALIDDAYHGLIYEPNLMRRSLFWELAERADPDKLCPMRLDGVTKELVFFGGRVGFISHPLMGEVQAALHAKLKCIARGTTNVPAGPSQALVLKALELPDLEDQIEQRTAVLKERYQRLKSELADLRSSKVRAWPFNSGAFALLEVDAAINAEQLRQNLIVEHSVGTVRIDGINALRLAYCSVATAAIPPLIRAIGDAVETFC